jgi:TolA-binding protein
MMKTAFMVVAAALFTTGVAKTSETISSRAERVMAPAAWSAKDPADSLYREARAALSKGDYAKAAELFRKINRDFPNSDYAGEALYYQAFAEYRLGGSDRLRSALQSLTQIQSRYPDLAKRSDARALRTRVCGELAKQGDEACGSRNPCD